MAVLLGVPLWVIFIAASVPPVCLAVRALRAVVHRTHRIAGNFGPTWCSIALEWLWIGSSCGER
jgi:hypothetical protein